MALVVITVDVIGIVQSLMLMLLLYVYYYCCRCYHYFFLVYLLFVGIVLVKKYKKDHSRY